MAPSSDDDGSECESESSKKSGKTGSKNTECVFKCCGKKCSVVVCRNCDTPYHKSCSTRLPNITPVSGGKVECCPSINTNQDKAEKYAGQKSDPNEEADINVKHENEKLRIEVEYLKMLVREITEKNEILKENNQLLIQRINTVSRSNTKKIPDKEVNKEVMFEGGNISSVERERKQLSYAEVSVNKGETIVKETKRRLRSGMESETGTSDSGVSKSYENKGSLVDQTSAKQSNRTTATANKQQNFDNNNEDEDGYRMVTHRKKKIFRKQIGTAEISNEQRESGFAGIQRKVWLHIYRVTRQTTPEMIVEYIKSKETFKNDEIVVKEIPTEENRYKNFIITAPLNKKDHLYDLTFWPEGIGIKRFNFRRHQDFLKQQNTFL